MGRISKRHASGTAAQKTDPVRKVYKTAVYARLSSDADTRKNESIEVQVAIIKDFIRKFNEEHDGERMEVYDVYNDLGKSGTNFERDEFARLMQDIRMREVNCLICKDLSRFGREYMDVGDYIEKIFPFLGVRFIAVSDGFDTGADGNRAKELGFEIKNLTNDMYAKDISAKLKISHRQRRERGHYIGGYAPYGYRTVMEDGVRKLYPNEETRKIVELIYSTFIQVKSYAGVMNELNSRKVNSINVYDRTGEVYYSGQGKYTGWNAVGIKAVLTSEIYRGNLVLGKRENRKLRDTNARWTKEEEWVWHYGTHDRIVPEDTIEKADAVLKEITERMEARKKKMPEHGEVENLFDGVIFCGVCGRAMVRGLHCREHADGTSRILETYGCPKGGRSDNDNCSLPNNLAKLKLMEILVPLMKNEFSLYLSDGKELLAGVDDVADGARKEYEKEIRSLKQRCMGYREKLDSLYLSMWKGEITKEQYPEIRKGTEEQCRKVEEKLAEQEKQLSGLEKKAKQCKRYLRAAIRLNDGETLDREMVQTLIQRIDVFPGRRIEVSFKYSAGLMKGGF